MSSTNTNTTTTNNNNRPTPTRRRSHDRPSPYDLPHAPRGSKGYRQSYGHGLFLWITPRGPLTDGTKSWRVEYAQHGRRHLITLGTFPEMTLAQAEDARRELARTLRKGEDPLLAKRAAQSRDLQHRRQRFDVMALQWVEQGARTTTHKAGWAPAYAKAVKWRIEAMAIPALGKMPIASIKTRDIMDLLEAVREKHGHWQMTHLRQHLDLMFQRWVIREYCDRNPAAGLEKEYAKPRQEHRPAVKKIEDARKVLKAIENSDALGSVILFHRFLALTGMRPMEACGAEWSEIHNGIWTVPAERMKGRRGRQRTHTVFLSAQARDVLAAARELQPAACKFVFPGRVKGKPINRSTLSTLMLCRLEGTGIDHVPHGWRRAKTRLLNQMHPEKHLIIDAMLAHEASKNQIAKIYDDTDASDHPIEIAKLEKDWADALLKGAPDAYALVGLKRPRTNVTQLADVA